MRTFSPLRRPDDQHHVGRVPEAGFTLIELLVTLVIVLVVLAALTDFLGNAERVWKSTADDPFAEAQDAFETVVDRVAGATLEPYQDYADANGNFRTKETSTSFVPYQSRRRSDLAFVCGPGSFWLAGTGRSTVGDAVFFTAPRGYTQTEAHLGLDRLLNALGYFVEFSDESSLPAFILPGSHRWRWRLKQIVQPSESLTIYQTSTSLPWIRAAVQSSAPTSILAENVVALIVLPERAANDPDRAEPISPDYRYDSRDSGNLLTHDQLPARVRLALVAINEVSAQILAGPKGAQPPELVSNDLFVSGASMDADLTQLDKLLTTRKIQHRIFQREILLPSATWSNSTGV